MIVKFFRHGTAKYGKTGATGGGGAVRDYLLKDPNDKTKDRTGATLIRGNADQTTEIINNINRKARYKSGVLSFAQGEIVTDEQKQEIINSFENTLFVGLDKDQYSGYWVEHQDKDRLELHFVFAETELKTGKSLAIYYHKVDKSLIDTWKDLTNDRYNLLDPNDPMTKKAITPNTLKTRNDKDNALKDEISERILIAIEKDPNVKTRDDVVKLIESLDYKVNRSNQFDSISIRHPDEKDDKKKRPLKLKGDIFSKDFSRDCLPSQREKQKIKHDKDYDNRIAQTQSDYQKYLALREKRTLKRIGEINRTTDPKLSAELDQIRADNQPNFLKQVAEYQRQELKKIIGQSIEQIYKQHEHDSPEQLVSLKELHKILIDGIDNQLKDEPLPKFDEVIANYQNSKNHIVTVNHIEYDRRQAELARQQAEQEFKANIQSQLDYMLSNVGEVLPQTNYIKWQSLSDSDLADYLTDYQRQGQLLLDKAHRDILTPQELQNDKIIKDVITTINDIMANRERDRLERLRAEQAKIKFDNQIKAQLDTLASITGQVTKSFYDSLRDYDPQQLAQMKATHTDLTERLLETARQKIISDFDNAIDKFTSSKNILATIDYISLERKQAQEQARVAEQKRLADMVKKPPTVTPKPQDKPSAPITLTQQNKPLLERVSVADDRNARLTQAQKVVADFDKLVKGNAEKLKTATVKDRTNKFNEASKALTDLGKKPLFMGKEQWEIDNKKLTLKKRNAEISLDQAKGDIEKLKQWNFKLELFREKELQPINYTAITLERLDKSVKDKVKQAYDVIEKINDEINCEKAQSLGADKLAKTGEIYMGKVIKVNQHGAYQQTSQGIVLHPTYANRPNDFKAEQSYTLDYRTQGEVLKSESNELRIFGNSKDINIDGNKGR